MASTINSTGTASGVVTTADSSGVLNLQGAGTTGISIDASGIPTATNGQFSVRRVAGAYGIDIITNNATGNTSIQTAGSGAILTIPDLTISGSLTGIGSNSVVSFLAGNVTLTSANTWYNVVNTGSIGAAGQKWVIFAKGEITWTGGAIAAEIAIHDGTNYLSGSSNVGAAATWTAMNIAMYFVTLSGATTFTMKAAANQNGALVVGNTSYYTVQRSTWITALRLS